jgi:hypothetical protein
LGVAGAIVLQISCSNGPQPANDQRTVANIPASPVAAAPGVQVPPEVALNGNLSERTNQKRSVDIPLNGPRQEPQHFDAPEDSTVTTTMNSQGQILEIRVFKTHPQLAKLESTWTGPKDRIIRLFLRDGTSRELTTDKVENLRAVTAAQMLEMAGIASQPPAAGAKGETDVKKRP